MHIEVTEDGFIKIDGKLMGRTNNPREVVRHLQGIHAREELKAA